MTQSPLRIIFCTSGGAHGAIVLKHLLHAPDAKVVGVIISSRAVRASYGFWRGASEHVRLSGIRYALYLWCSTSLADWLLGGSSVAAQSRRARLARLTTRNANGTEGLEFSAQLAPDLLVSAFFNQRIETKLASIPSLGAVNIHPSPLPLFRGVDPVFFTRLRGHDATGVTVHRIVDELDAGHILRRETRPVRSVESVFAATSKLYELGAQLLVGALREISQRSAGTPQAPGGTYDSWPTRQQIGASHRQGIKLVRLRDLWKLSRTQTHATKTWADSRT
ncbi:MAG: formyltransferase family protein [Betaproteobacteria bacterium]